MDLFSFAKAAAREEIFEVVSQGEKRISNSTMLGKSVSQWDKERICIGPLKTANLTPYNHCLGLYRHVMNGKTMLLSPDNYLDKAY